MIHKRCPHCHQRVITIEMDGPSEITIRPCGHAIGTMEKLIDADDLAPQSPGEWLTKFLADSDDN